MCATLCNLVATAWWLNTILRTIMNGENFLNVFFCVLFLCEYFISYQISFYPLVQQSVAFKILRTRLKTVPPYSFSGEQFRRPSQGNTFSEVNYVGGPQIAEDGELNADIRNVHNGINFASWLNQFEQVQQEHRSHTKSQALSRCSSISYSKVRIFNQLDMLKLIFLYDANNKLAHEFNTPTGPK